MLTLAIIHLTVFSKSIEINYQVEELKQKFNRLLSENRSLAAAVSRKNSLDYIDKIAQEKLGMVYPEKLKYLKKNY